MRSVCILFCPHLLAQSPSAHALPRHTIFFNVEQWFDPTASAAQTNPHGVGAASSEVRCVFWFESPGLQLARDCA